MDMLQFIWVTMKHSEIFSSSPNLPNRRMSPRRPTLVNRRHRQHTVNPWKVDSESRPTSQASNFYTGTRQKYHTEKMLSPFPFNLQGSNAPSKNTLRNPGLSDGFHDLSYWLPKNTQGIWCPVSLQEDWGKGSFWTKCMSSHLTLDHYSLPGPVMNIPSQGTGRENIAQNLRWPSCSKVKGEALTSNIKNREEAKARKTTRKGAEGITDTRPARPAKATKHGWMSPTELWRIKLIYLSTWEAHARGCHLQWNRMNLQSSVPGEGGKMEQRAAEISTRLAGSFCHKLDPYQINTAKLQPWGISENTFFGVLFLRKASSLSSWICPNLHQPGLSLDSECPSACSALMAVEPVSPAVEVLPPVLMQSWHSNSDNQTEVIQGRERDNFTHLQWRCPTGDCPLGVPSQN